MSRSSKVRTRTAGSLLVGPTSIAAACRRKYRPTPDRRVIVPPRGRIKHPTNHTGATREPDDIVRASAPEDGRTTGRRGSTEGQDGTVHHGRSGASRISRSGSIISRRLVMAGGARGGRGRGVGGDR